MDDLRSWWEIAQLAGAGAALVLGPVAMKLWNRNVANEDYIRDSERNTLNVLNELVKALEKNDQAVSSMSEGLKTSIENAVRTITAHFDARTREG